MSAVSRNVIPKLDRAMNGRDRLGVVPPLKSDIPMQPSPRADTVGPAFS